MALTVNGDASRAFAGILSSRKVKNAKLLERVLGAFDLYAFPDNVSSCTNCSTHYGHQAIVVAKMEAIEHSHNPDLSNLLRQVCLKMLDKGLRNGSEVAECQQLLYPASEEDRLPEDSIGDLSLASKCSLAVLYALIMTISLVGNLLVVLSLIFNRHLRSIVNVFIVSLALSDLLITLTSMPFNLGTALTKYWVFGGFACKVMPFMSNLTVASSALTLCCIAIDRYYAIVHPLKLRSVRTPKRAALLLVVVWVLSIGCSVPYAHYFTLMAVCTKSGGCRHPESSPHVAYICMEPVDNRIVVTLAWVTLLVLLVFPVLFLSGVYGRIVVALWVKKPVGTGPTQYKRKAIKMLVLVVLAFVISWSPLFVFNVVATNASETNLALRYFLQWLALSSACYNPVVYAFMNDRFRRTYAHLLSCKQRPSRAVAPASSPCPARRPTQERNHPPNAAGNVTTTAAADARKASLDRLQPRASCSIFTTAVGGAPPGGRARGVDAVGGAKRDVIKVGGVVEGVVNVSMAMKCDVESVFKMDDATAGNKGPSNASVRKKTKLSEDTVFEEASNESNATRESFSDESDAFANEASDVIGMDYSTARWRKAPGSTVGTTSKANPRIVIVAPAYSPPNAIKSPIVMEAREATLSKPPSDRSV